MIKAFFKSIIFFVRNKSASSASVKDVQKRSDHNEKLVDLFLSVEPLVSRQGGYLLLSYRFLIKEL